MSIRKGFVQIGPVIPEALLRRVKKHLAKRAAAGEYDSLGALVARALRAQIDAEEKASEPPH